MKIKRHHYSDFKNKTEWFITLIPTCIIGYDDISYSPICFTIIINWLHFGYVVEFQFKR